MATWSSILVSPSSGLQTSVYLSPDFRSIHHWNIYYITGEPGGKYTFEEFKAFISNRLADEEEITRFNDDRAKIRFIARFLDGDAAKWWNVTMKSDSFAASNCQIEMASFWSAMAERYAITNRPYE